MLIDFEFSNFRSFRDTTKLTLEAVKAYKEREEENVFTVANQRFLKSAGIYGPNAGGKTNLVYAVAFMTSFVRNSASRQAGDPISITPFKLDTATEKAPSRFQVTLLDGTERFRYGFEVDFHTVRSEWLFATNLSKKHSRERTLFLREGDEIDVKPGGITDAKDLKKRTLENALFLSVAAQWNEPTARRVLELMNRIRPIWGTRDNDFLSFSAELATSSKAGKVLLEACRSADLGIENIRVEEHDFDPNVPGVLSQIPALKVKNGEGDKLVEMRVLMEHPKYNGDEIVDRVSFNLMKEESEGTRKYFNLMGPILDTLQNGYTVFIDELEAKLHPLLTRSIVRLFHTPEINKNNAQLVFCTHDTGLLSNGGLRRDQIWFVEKSARGASTLYPLSDFAGVRKDTQIEKGYIQGRFGAIPFLGGTDALDRLMEG